MVFAVQADTHPNTSETTLDDQHRRMTGRDGIREDYIGDAFAITLSTNAPTLTVASAGRSALVDGNLLDFTGQALDAVLDPRDIGPQPGPSQVRRDLVVLRYDEAVAIIANRGQLAIKPGVPGASSAEPVAVRDTGGVWELEVGSYVFPGTGGLLTTKRDLRSWSGDYEVLTPGRALIGPIGSTRGQGNALRRRVWTADRGPYWVRDTDRVVAPLVMGTSFVPSDGSGFVSTPYVSQDPSGRCQWHGEISGGASGVSNLGRVIARTDGEFAPAAGQAESFVLPLAGSTAFPPLQINAFVRRNGGAAELVCSTAVTGGLSRVSLSGISYYGDAT